MNLDSCSLPNAVSKAFGIISCNDNINFLSEDKENYGIGWTPSTFLNTSTIQNSSYLLSTENVFRAFHFQDEAKSGGKNFQGRFGQYTPGGYIALLGMNRYEAE